MRPTCGVIPAAGKGTRLYPLTYAVPKELLPLGPYPTIQHVAFDLAAAGMTEIVIVTSAGKGALKRHFDALVESERTNLQVRYVVQHQQHGLGDAVNTACEAVAERSFAVALGDAVIVGSSPGALLRRMCNVFTQHDADAVVAVETVCPADTARYGIVEPAETVDDAVRLAGLVEKPGPERAPSNLAICGRYLFKPVIFEHLAGMQPGAGGELQLTDALAALARDGGAVYACPLQRPESRLDVGDLTSYYRSLREVLNLCGKCGHQ